MDKDLSPHLTVEQMNDSLGKAERMLRAWDEFTHDNGYHLVRFDKGEKGYVKFDDKGDPIGEIDFDEIFLEFLAHDFKRWFAMKNS